MTVEKPSVNLLLIWFYKAGQCNGADLLTSQRSGMTSNEMSIYSPKADICVKQMQLLSSCV